MTSVKPLAFALLLSMTAAQSVEAATVYRCIVNGRTVFQQSACASDEAASAAAAAVAPVPKTGKPAIPPASASGASAPDKPAKPARPG